MQDMEDSDENRKQEGAENIDQQIGILPHRFLEQHYNLLAYAKLPHVGGNTISNTSEQMQVGSIDQKRNLGTSEQRADQTKTQFTFPQKLMAILSDQRNSSIISWLPHGKGWIIQDKKRFADEVAPRYFYNNPKFTSFTRKLNRWQFTRVTRGPETGAYYHPLFLRDNAALSAKMTCIGSRSAQRVELFCPIALGLHKQEPLPHTQTHEEMGVQYQVQVPEVQHMLSFPVHQPYKQFHPDIMQQKSSMAFVPNHQHFQNLHQIPTLSPTPTTTANSSSQGSISDALSNHATMKVTSKSDPIDQVQQQYQSALMHRDHEQSQQQMASFPDRQNQPQYSMFDEQRIEYTQPIALYSLYDTHPRNDDDHEHIL